MMIGENRNVFAKRTLVAVPLVKIQEEPRPLPLPMSTTINLKCNKQICVWREVAKRPRSWCLLPLTLLVKHSYDGTKSFVVVQNLT